MRARLVELVIGNHMTFSANVGCNIQMQFANSGLFMLCQLQTLGLVELINFIAQILDQSLNIPLQHGINFYPTFIKDRLEKIQQMATKFILPDVSYEDWPTLLTLDAVNAFIFERHLIHFRKTANDRKHPFLVEYY